MYSHPLPGYSSSVGYGYLWWVDHGSFSEPCFYASGLGGHRIYVFPASELVIVHRVNTYLNQSEEEENIHDLIQKILSSRKGTTVQGVELLEMPKPLNQITEQSRMQNTCTYCGIYDHPFFHKIKVSEKQGYLSISGNILGHFRLRPIAEDTYSIEDLDEITLQFKPHNNEYMAGEAISSVTDEGNPLSIILFY